jgi:hypothetical protein
VKGIEPVSAAADKRLEGYAKNLAKYNVSNFKRGLSVLEMSLLK